MRDKPIWADYMVPVVQRYEVAVAPSTLARNAVKARWLGRSNTPLVHVYDEVVQRLNDATPKVKKVRLGVPLRVYAAADEGQTHEVEFRDDIAHEQSDVVDELVLALAAQPEVRRVWREDRERLILDAPGWSVAQVRAWFRNACRERGL